jgi:tetratricopeptide (TPR) repeat protein
LGDDSTPRLGAHTSRKDVLEEELLPEEGSDLGLRREAAQLYGKVASIHFSLGHWRKAIEARDRQVDLLSGLLEEEANSQELRRQLADAHCYRGHAFRDVRKLSEGRAAYDQAINLLEQLLRESPGDPKLQVMLSNTLLNKTTVLSFSTGAAGVERLYQRTLELDEAALATEPQNALFQEERALALHDQGLFFLAVGRANEALAKLRAALEVRKALHGSRPRARAYDRYLAGNYAALGQGQSAAGKTKEAEQSFAEALSLLEKGTNDFPEVPYFRIAWVDTLSHYAHLLVITALVR